MKKYASTQEWQDLTDMHLYREGEPFPFDGRDVPEERLEALESGRNRAGLRLICAVEVPDEPEEVPEAEAPEEAEKAEETEAEKPVKTAAKRTKKSGK